MAFGERPKTGIEKLLEQLNRLPETPLREVLKQGASKAPEDEAEKMAAELKESFDATEELLKRPVPLTEDLLRRVEELERSFEEVDRLLKPDSKDE